jgi:hypothetical protein
MNDAQNNFTAAQIALALGKTPQAVRRQLCDTAPLSKKIVRGNETAAWMFDQLPGNLKAALNSKAEFLKCRNAEALLCTPRQQWQRPFPLSEIADKEIQAAQKLREALKPFLIQQYNPNLTSAEFKKQGVESYARIFGNYIKPRYWDKLMKRARDRDNGYQNWNRIENYLSECPAKKILTRGKISATLAEDFAELEDFISACQNSNASKKTKSVAVWTQALKKCTELVRAGHTEKSAARRVREFLFARAKFLSVSRNALFKMFTRKLVAFQNAQGDCKVLRDGRENNGARFALPKDDRDLLIHRAVFTYHGDIAPAWRDLLREGFSAETISRYRGRAANKSHVPESIRESISDEVENLNILHRGPRAFDARKGYVSRNYDGLHSLDCMQGDDFTLNSYFYIPDGKGWFTLTRGQTILFIDLRSSRILGWALEPRASYSSLTIRSLCTHIFEQFGVPKVLYFERGIWKNSNLLKGKTDPFDFTEISQGLREFGVEFIHAIRPRSKTIERIGGIFQDMAEAEPGYCGRDERRDAPESLRKQMAEVASKKNHPSKFFYSYEQWNHRIGEIAERYNAEPQQGKILKGLSPEQGFEKFLNHENPTMQFDANTRYLLATDKRRARVTLNGVTIQVGKQKFNYRGQEIAHLVGKEVLAFFDPENSEIMTVTDLDRKNPICVMLSEEPNVLQSLVEPDSPVLRNELSRIEGQASYMKTRFNVLKTKFALPQRLMLAAAPVVELGEEINVQKTKISEKQIHRQHQRRQAQQFASWTGIAVPEHAQDKFQPEDARKLSDFLKGKPTP